MDVAKRLLRTARDGKYEDLSVEKLEIYVWIPQYCLVDLFIETDTGSFARCFLSHRLQRE